jgi:GH15 family glucan-1,4-alpha-glucosidase
MKPYPPLDEFGVIGDMESAALVHREGSVDWLCLPRFDSPWVFGRLLDWRHGGYLRLAPEDVCAPFRRYRTDSNVLETTWIGEREQAQVTDFMPLRLGGRRRSPPESLRLLRMIQPVRGKLRWCIEFCPVFHYGRKTTRFSQRALGAVVARAGSESVTLEYPQQFEVARSEGVLVLKGSIEVGETAVIALHHAGRRDRAPHVPWRLAAELLDETDRFWRAWLQQCTYQGRYAPLVRRSALLLKLLQYQPSGAFVAAPTTSLPEAERGSLNWDYRYTWLRDMSVLVDTLHQLGFVDEVDKFMEWLDRICERESSALQMLYRVDGDPRVAEHELTELDGYRGSRPVRIGNAAADQKQLDVYGEVIEAAHAAWKHDNHLPRRRRATLLQIVDYVLNHWQEPDSGIWESRSHPRRYVYSQAMCWLALDRALRMDATLRLGQRRRSEAHRARSRIRREVLAHGFNRRLGAFAQALDDDTLDASGLTVPLTGLLPARDPRVAATVDAVKKHLTRAGLVYRHVEAASEFAQDEGAFLVCSFWLVDLLAQMGRTDEAQELFARVSRTANDLGLFAEEFDPDSGTLVGNFPLALSHLSMLGAVINLERAAKRRGGRIQARPQP